MNLTPRVAAVHDMSGLGRCSLTVALPVLSAMGAQCCPLPTAVLSAHTAFPASHLATFLDLTAEMERMLLHWRKLHVSFDAIYSGFLGSEQQIGILHRLLSEFRRKETLVLVDPVMGDHGKVYRTYTPEMCRLMGELAAGADLITPNLTEAAILLGEDYSSVPTGQAGMERWLTRLSLEGRRSVVITGVSFAPARSALPWLGRSTANSPAPAISSPQCCWAPPSGARRWPTPLPGQWILSRSASPALLRQGPPCWTACSSSRF